MYDEGEYQIISSLQSKDDNFILFWMEKNENNPWKNVAKGDSFYTIYSKIEKKILKKDFHFTDEELKKYNFPKIDETFYEACQGTSYNCLESIYMYNSINKENEYLKSILFDSLTNVNISKIITQIEKPKIIKVNPGFLFSAYKEEQFYINIAKKDSLLFDIFKINFPYKIDNSIKDTISYSISENCYNCDLKISSEYIPKIIAFGIKYKLQLSDLLYKIINSQSLNLGFETTKTIVEYYDLAKKTYILHYQDKESENKFFGFDNDFNKIDLNKKLVEMLNIIFTRYSTTNGFKYLTNDYCFFNQGIIYQLDIKNLSFNPIYNSPFYRYEVLSKRIPKNWSDKDVELLTEFQEKYKFNQFKTTNFKFFKNKEFYDLKELTDTPSFINNSINVIENDERVSNYEFLYKEKAFSIKIEPKSNGSFLIHNYNSRTDTLRYHYFPELHGITANKRFLFYEKSLLDLKLNEPILELNYYFNSTSLYPIFNDSYTTVLIPRNEFQYEIFDISDETIQNNEYRYAQKLADYYYYDEDNWYIITPEGYYDKSENSNKNLYWVYNDIEVYEIDNFKQYFHIQGLKDKILNGETYKTTSAKSLSETFTENLPPLIDAYLENNTIHYNIDARNGTLPENIYLNINGKDRTIPIKSSENKKKTQGTIELVEFIDKLSPDTSEINQLHLRAYTKSIHNFFHKTQTFEYTLPQDVVKKYYKTNDTQPHIYMLFVGINEFKNKNFTLNYSEKDASKMNLFLDKATKKLFNNDRKNRVHSTLLTNENATKDKIFAELDAIKKNAKSNDVVLLFFSTHGLSLSTILNETNDQIALENIKNGKLKDNYYLLTQNADLNENTFKDFLKEDQKLQTLISVNAISYVELMQYFTNNDWKPYKDILIVDACQSGKIVDLYNDKNKNVINDDDKRKKLLRGFNSISGTYTITASSANQVAKENAELGHSVLTYGLLSSLTYAEKENEEDINYLQLENWFETAKENIRTTNSQIPITHYGGNSKLPIAEVDNDIAQEIRKYLNDKKKLIKIDFDNGKETYQEDNEQIAQLLKEELRKFEKNETTNFKIIKEDSNLDSYFLKFTYDILKKDEKAQLICNLYYYEKVANSNRKRKNIYDDKTFEVDIENKETLLIQIKNTITQINNQLINKEI